MRVNGEGALVDCKDASEMPWLTVRCRGQWWGSVGAQRVWTFHVNPICNVWFSFNSQNSGKCLFVCLFVRLNVPWLSPYGGSTHDIGTGSFAVAAGVLCLWGSWVFWKLTRTVYECAFLYCVGSGVKIAHNWAGSFSFPAPAPPLNHSTYVQNWKTFRIEHTCISFLLLL